MEKRHNNLKNQKKYPLHFGSLRRFVVLFCICFSGSVTALSLSDEHTQQIAQRIWKNECGGTIAGLTSWNKGENFASLGIGHFLWYPENKPERFQDTFPALVAYIKEQGGTVPDWIAAAKGCPWNTREEFQAALDSEKMRELRQFLYDSREFQARFIVQRLEDSLPQMLAALDRQEKRHVMTVYRQMTKSPQGFYALIDYLNFKGPGISASERYAGQGWGLLQVLQRTPVKSKHVVAAFVEAASQILQERVKNAPKERNEERWLKGWQNRLQTYLKD